MKHDDEEQRVTQARAIANIRGILSSPQHLDFLLLKSQLAKERFEALVKAGFSPEQALVLCPFDIELA